MGCRWATRPCPWEGVTHPLRRAAKDVQKEKAEATRVCRKCVCGSARLRAAGDLCSVFPTKYMELLFVYMHDACMYILHSSACGTTTTPAPSSPPSASTPSSTPSSWQRTPDIYIYIYIYIYIQRNNPLGKVHLRGIESARTHLRTHAVAHARTHARTSGLGRVRCRRRGRLRSRAPPEAGVRRASRAAAPLRSRTPSSSPGKRLRRQVELGPTPPNVAPPTAERGHRARSRVTALAPAKQAAGPPTACRVPRLTGR